MFSGVVHVVACVRISFFFLKAEWYSIVCIYHILLFHSSFDSPLDCFHLWLLQIMLLWTCVYKYLFKILLSCLLCVHTEVKFGSYSECVYVCVCVCVCVLVTQSCPTLCNIVNCSLSGFSLHGIFQARKLEWVAIIIIFHHDASLSSQPGLNQGPWQWEQRVLTTGPPGNAQ